jgi:DNA replication protein DnaC
MAVEKERARLESWARLCPAEFRKPLEAKRLDTIALNAMVGWSFGATGLYIHGPSGTGKTRMAWHALRRHYNEGRRVFGITHLDLRQQLARLWNESVARMKEFVDLMLAADILFLDDLGRANPGGLGEEAIAAVVDHRYRAGKPTWVTALYQLESLAARFSPERGQLIATRIAACTVQVPVHPVKR